VLWFSVSKLRDFEFNGTAREFDSKSCDTIQVGHNVAEKISRYAQAHGIQLIVMATRGRTGLAHFWAGSITEDVVRSAPCPVLVIGPSATAIKKPQPL
jgi:nucleotide-binding universal stress UspA family protein